MADLTLTITEAVTLNGTSHGATNTQTVTGVTKVLHRIIGVKTSGYADMAQFGAVNSGVATISNQVKHFRITNLDSTNFITLRVREEGVQEYFVKLEAGDSFILGAAVIDANDSGSGASASLTDLDKIEAIADTAACDVEIFIAS